MLHFREKLGSTWLAIWLCLLLAGCGGSKRRPTASIPLPPPPATQKGPPVVVEEPAPPAPTPTKPAEPGKPATPVYTEVGIASWYGPAFHEHHTANGEIYDMNAFTAAHRTLPFNSMVRVTNVSNGLAVNVRITDRGPFVPDRVLDLSMSAAKRIDLWHNGTAKVRIEVLSSPADVSSGGRWAVQIGSFDDADSAARMKEKLVRRYRTANVLQFPGGQKGWWIRVRVQDDDRRRAEEVARDNPTPQGEIYLVRLD